MAFQPIGWKQQYVVAVTRGSKTRYFYGATLNEAVNVANLKPGDGFAYAKFERGTVQYAEARVSYGPFRRKKVA